jgi:phosphatidyl-myo-inositol dimannoside synthase
VADILGVYPTLSEMGGVQASGRLAQAALGRASIEVSAGRRGAAVIAALRADPSVDGVVFWHLSLLKLLPFLRLSRQARVAVFLHGIEAWRPAGRFTRRVDLFLSNSEFTWQRFVVANPQFEAAAHHVVPLGIGEPVVGEPPEPAEVPAALMLGRLARCEDYKGHREVLAAWPHVLRSMPDARLVIAGDGDLRPELEHLAAKLGLRESVRFLGRVSEVEKQRLLGDCRCLALPSRGEGFGLVYLEAMRMGRPCLVSTLDAAREVVQPPVAGLAVEPSQPEQLAAKLCELLRIDQTWQQRSAAARERYAHHFTAQHFQDRLRAALAGSIPSTNHVRYRRRAAA